MVYRIEQDWYAQTDVLEKIQDEEARRNLVALIRKIIPMLGDFEYHERRIFIA